MLVKLSKKPKSPIIINGFPGFGLVGTIASEFLSEHLNVEVIGKYWFEETPATIAIHESKIINPVTIYYNKKYNIIVVHSITAVQGLEWKAADLIIDIAKQTNAKEIIGLEGVGSAKEAQGQDDHPEEHRIFFYTNNPANAEKVRKTGAEELKESIIMGITAAILLKTNIKTTVLFAQVHSNLPDSKAAAKLIEVLDKYMKLKVDYRPLIKMAEQLEGKLKKLISESQELTKQQKAKQLDYMG